MLITRQKEFLSLGMEKWLKVRSRHLCKQAWHDLVGRLASFQTMATTEENNAKQSSDELVDCFSGHVV